MIEALSDYQNGDGGFGQALEPDLRSHLSTVYSTSQGLFILRDIGANSDESIVQNAMQYLLDMYDETRSVGFGDEGWPYFASSRNGRLHHRPHD